MAGTSPTPLYQTPTKEKSLAMEDPSTPQSSVESEQSPGVPDSSSESEEELDIPSEGEHEEEEHEEMSEVVDPDEIDMLLNLEAMDEEESEEEEEYDDDPIEHLFSGSDREDACEDEELLVSTSRPRAPSRAPTAARQVNIAESGRSDGPSESHGGVEKHVVSHVRISPQEYPEFGIPNVPGEYMNAYTLVDKPAVVMAFEIPLTAFGDDLYRAVSSGGTGSDNDITISMIKHQDPRYTHTKTIATLLARVCTLGAYESHAMKESTKKEHLAEPFEGKPVRRRDLTVTERGSTRLNSDFCNHPAYIKMLTTLNNNQMMFDYVMEESMGLHPHQIPLTPSGGDGEAGDDGEYHQEGEDEEHEEGESRDTRPLTRTVMKEHVRRCTVENVPQLAYFMEELVDNDFQPKGWRVWIVVNDPGINLGTNLDFVLRNNAYLARPTNQRRSRNDPTMSMSSPTCYQRVDREKYQNTILRRSTALGHRHPVRQLTSSEPPHPSESDKNNPFFPSNVFHPYYSVVFGPTTGVCRAQRDPTNYFDFEAIGMSLDSITCFQDLDALHTVDALRNARTKLPPFTGRFAVPVLVNPWSLLATTPEHFWRSPLPFHIREKAFTNTEIVLTLTELAPSLRESRIMSSDASDVPETLRANMDTSGGGSTDWARVMEEAQAMQERRFAQDDFLSANPREFYQRENHQKSNDPLSKLSIASEDKEKLFARDALIRFNIYASGKKIKLKEDMKGVSQKEMCKAMRALKISLLKEFEEKIRTYEGDTSQIPQSFATGYTWFRALRAEDQWPDFPTSVMKSDSGNLVSPFMNMIVKIYAGVKQIFWLNAGEVQAGVMRAMLCRNTALHLVFDIKCNLILWGPAGASKSMMLKVVEELAHPGSVWALTHITENTFVTDDNQCYVWIVMEEGEAAILGVDKKTGKEVAGDAVLKNILTAGLATTSMCQIIETVRKRISSVSILMASFAVCNNYVLPPESNPMQSRFLRDVISVRQKGASSADLSAEEKDTNLRTGGETAEEMITMYRIWHFYCHVVERLIGGVFEDVNMSVFNLRAPLFRRWMKDRCKIPVRKQMMFFEAGRSLVIMYAVYLHFFTETARSRHKIESASGRCRRLQMEDFIGLEAHLVFTEEMFVYLMTLFHRFYMPICEYEVIQAIRKFLHGEALIYPTIPTHQGRGTIEDLSRLYSIDGKYLGRRAITNGARGSSGRPASGSSGGRSSAGNARTSLMGSRTGSLTARLNEERRQRGMFRRGAREEGSSGDYYPDEGAGFYDATELAYGSDQLPSELHTHDVEELLDLQFAEEMATAEGGSEIRLTVTQKSSSSGLSFNNNYIGLKCRKKQDIVMAISTTMECGLSPDAISSILSSMMNRTLQVDDLNRDVRNKKKINCKILTYMKCPTTTKDGSQGGYGGKYRGPAMDQMYYISTGALMQHFREIHILDELRRFMSHQFSSPATFITAMPLREEQKYLDILATIEVRRDPRHILIKKHAITPRISDNALVYNGLSSVARSKKITRRQANPFHVIDADLDLLALYQHYRATYHFARRNPAFWPHDLHGYWVVYTARIWKFRRENKEYFRHSEVIGHYPKDMVEVIEEEEKKEKEIESFQADIDKNILKPGKAVAFTQSWKEMGLGYQDLTREQSNTYPEDGEIADTYARAIRGETHEEDAGSGAMYEDDTLQCEEREEYVSASLHRSEHEEAPQWMEELGGSSSLMEHLSNSIGGPEGLMDDMREGQDDTLVGGAEDGPGGPGSSSYDAVWAMLEQTEENPLPAPVLKLAVQEQLDKQRVRLKEDTQRYRKAKKPVSMPIIEEVQDEVDEGRGTTRPRATLQEEERPERNVRPRHARGRRRRAAAT
jgi:hypothetical protein